MDKVVSDAFDKLLTVNPLAHARMGGTKNRSRTSQLRQLAGIKRLSRGMRGRTGIKSFAP